jgi:hypothetical protein
MAEVQVVHKGVGNALTVATRSPPYQPLPPALFPRTSAKAKARA